MDDNDQLLQDLSIILNAHQDIEDLIDKYRVKPALCSKKEFLKKLEECSGRIGEAVVRHLPG